MDPKTPLEPGVVIAERFRVDQAVAFDGAGPAFLATDQETGDRLLVFDAELAEADALRHGVGTQHPHLATIRGLVAHGSRDVLLTEHVVGLTVESFADGTPRLTQVDVARFALRALDALQALHNVGAAHGFVQPAALIMEPDGRPRPVMAFAPSRLGPSVYRCPERGTNGPPSIADDSWAAGALLHRMLTGKDAPAAGFSAESEISDVDTPLLKSALFHSLAADATKRSDSLQPLRRELARWFADHAGDGSSNSSMLSRPPPLPDVPPLPGARASVPEPESLPPTAAPSGPRSGPTEVAPRPRRSAPLIFAVVAAVLGLGAAWGVSAWRAKPKVTVITTSAPREAPPAAASAVSLGEVAVTGESEGDSGGGADLAVSCVSAHFPKDTFKKSPDLSWLCTEVSPLTGGEKLRVAVVQGAAGGAPTDAQTLFAKVGWYEMALFAVIRTSCCTEPPAMSLPEPSAGCEPLVGAATDIGKAVAGKQSLDEPLAAFAKAARCETDAKKASLFRRGGPPQPSEEAAFKELLKSVTGQ
ncbi:MAG: hypothetical protein IPI67_31030 [Myxococcales bacterium]|nr:hypothetical protein [Myxococcales bacterium]